MIDDLYNRCYEAKSATLTTTPARSTPMGSDLLLRRKWTLRAHGEQVVFVKKKRESQEHVLMKAFLWALYLPTYAPLTVEISIGDKYKPDVVGLDASGHPVFWGEAGKIGVQKMASLTRRFRNTHFALAKWGTDLTPYIHIVRDALDGLHRTAPFDLLAFPSDSAERFIDAHGHITITHDNLTWIRLK